jgi:type IV pilus assembly protein PilP
MKTESITLLGCAALLVAVSLGSAEPGTNSPALNSVPGQAPSPTLPVAAGNENAQPVASNLTTEPVTPRSYDPSGRRDPFVPVLQQLGLGPIDPTLPPLQRVGLTEMNLIAVIWGAYGNTAMVQTPDGNGYTVRRGTRIGPNNGVVSAVTEKGIVVQERFTDVYGSKQEREYVKLLHPKEGPE